jgi:peroxiredoxin
MTDLTGKPAFSFNLTDVNGKLHQLADYRGSWLLMMFHRHLG